MITTATIIAGIINTVHHISGDTIILKPVMTTGNIIFLKYTPLINPQQKVKTKKLFFQNQWKSKKN